MLIDVILYSALAMSSVALAGWIIFAVIDYFDGVK
jgi:hypothetical protein